MCTVSYVPLASGGFVFTSNRDEAPQRSTADLQQQLVANQCVLFPRDSGAGGTWIAVSEHDRLVCVLNGAFTGHERQPPYRRSRGLMALDYFGYTDFATFVETYDFVGIEPFTFIVWEHGTLQELRWDGEQRHPLTLAPDAQHLWSSATLYDSAAQTLRKGWFRDWQTAHAAPTPAEVMQFHTESGADDDWNGVIMNRMDRVCTVSITQVVRQTAGWHMAFRELRSDVEAVHTLPLAAAFLTS